MEVFKDIKGYEGLYQVSNKGSVKSIERKVLHMNGFRAIKERLLKPVKNSVGYLAFNLYKNGKAKQRTVHQLVAESFLNHEPCGYKLVVNHKDFNKKNNIVENLEIVTVRENTNRKHIKSSSKYVGVTWSKKAKKWKSQIQINGKRKHLGLFNTELEASEAYQNKLELLAVKQ